MSNTATCINLSERFGKSFRIEYDPSHSGRADDPWLQIIPGKSGHIYPHGANTLGVATNTRGSAARGLAKLNGVRVVQDGDDGINAVFPVELFAKVAKMVKAKRKRQLTAEQRQAACERLAQHRFSPARKAPQNELETIQAA